jgi:hypothetical protein
MRLLKASISDDVVFTEVQQNGWLKNSKPVIISVRSKIGVTDAGTRANLDGLVGLSWPECVESGKTQHECTQIQLNPAWQ